MSSTVTRRLRRADLLVDKAARSDWTTADRRTPGVGECVYCTEGMAQVVRLLGRTSDGSRLLELRLAERDAPPFFAAASNVLIAPGRAQD